METLIQYTDYIQSFFIFILLIRGYIGARIHKENTVFIRKIIQHLKND